MLKPLIAGNWKMHGSSQTTETLLAALANGLKLNPQRIKDVDVLVCPPTLFLERAAQLLSEPNNAAIQLGAQNLCAQEVDQGAYTGEVSASMLAQAGCSYVLVGHSERRAYYAESDELVAQKAQNALDKGLLAVVCVGETLEQREAQQTLDVVKRQLQAVLNVTQAQKLIVAYEPVWAIGTGLSATPEQAQQVHANIREILQVHYSELSKTQDQAASTHILYGGSVKPATAKELMAQIDIDGLLVGGASLVSADFLSIIEAARSV